MQRRELSLLLDWALLLVAPAAFSSGLVLFLCFHTGDGAHATSALGQSKLFWLNLHRFSAAVAALGVGAHVALNWRPFCARLTNVITRRTKKPINSELIMYVAFFLSASTGFVAWWILEGSTPLLGPTLIGHASKGRHAWIDVHDISSLVSLLLVVQHFGHRWRFMFRPPRPAGVARREVSDPRAVRSGAIQVEPSRERKRTCFEP